MIAESERLRGALRDVCTELYKVAPSVRDVSSKMSLSYSICLKRAGVCQASQIGYRYVQGTCW